MAGGEAADHAWNVAAYEAFSDLRLRPALDLLARVFSVPDGDIVDLGCGAGAAGPALRARFPHHRLIGVDASSDMLAKASERSIYDELSEADFERWTPGPPPALIFSNAALHWVGDHETLVQRLFAALAPGGALAVQMPGQLARPSHQTMLTAARAVRPDLFESWTPFPGHLAPDDYAEMLDAAAFDLWETEYHQRLPASADGAHPVRVFVSSTGARPILSRLDAAETAAFVKRWDAALDEAYPRQGDGGAWFPFRRLFFVAVRPD